MDTDVLVIGTGVAACSAALELAKKGHQITMVTKGDRPEESNTYHAQGGIIYKGEKDRPELLVKDIQEAGAGATWSPAAQILAQEGPQLVEDILIKKVQVPFNVNEEGKLDLTEEAAHSMRRIIHSDDFTGKAIETSLIQHVSKIPQITILTNHVAIDLITPEHHSLDPLAIYPPTSCLGAYVFNARDRKATKITAAVTILATGGLGQAFLHTTNPDGATGDGFAMAYRAGAKLINMEYVQFHPTTLFHKDAKRFLISESVRGEGAVLKTPKGKTFMEKYHPLGSLAPRDVVARAIHEEMVEHGYKYVLLDLASYMDSEAVRRRFPMIYETCLQYGIDMTKEPIPVVPAVHFSCGGVKVDLWGKTSINRLFAVGEVSCTGLHGANRLASTSLLEGLVWGNRAARWIHQNWEEYIKEIPPFPITDWIDTGMEEPDPALIKQDLINLRHIMWNYVGLVRTRKRLKRAITDLRHLWREVEDFYKYAKLHQKLLELRNGIQTGLIITRAAQRNHTSRGCHFRKD